MKRTAFLSTAVFVMVVAGRSVFAGHLPPVDPLVAGGDHLHENHSGHDHSGVNVPSIDLRWADLNSANLSSANLSSAKLNSVDLSFATLNSANLNLADLNQADLRNPISSEAISGLQLRSVSNATGVNFSGNDMAGFDLSGLDLNNNNFSFSNLSFSDLSSGQFQGGNFGSANLNFANLSSANLTDTIFDAANLSGADLRNTDPLKAITAIHLQQAVSVAGVNVNGNDLTNFDLPGLDFAAADFGSTDLGGANLISANLTSANFHLANVHSTDFHSSNLTGADLRNSVANEAITAASLRSAFSITNVNLSGNDMSGFNLSGMDLGASDLSSANLGAANLSSAVLLNVNLNSADVTSANLSGANLQNAVSSEAISDGQLQSAADVSDINVSGNNMSGFDLSGLDLGFADFSSANLENAILATHRLRYANFRNANLSGAVLGDGSRLDGFVYEGNLDVMNGTTTLKTLGYANLGPLTTLDNGATLAAANGVALGVGDNLAGNGHVDAKVAAGFGSIIQADGDLALGDTNAFDGFFSDGVLRTNDNAVTLHDRDKAVLGSLTELGNANGPGTLIAANGMLIEAGKTLIGHGDVTGDLDNRGTLIPGASAGVLSVEGNYDQSVSGGLVVEIGGLDNSDPLNPQFDALHVADAASIAGTLDVSVTDGFVPSTPLGLFGGDGDTFTILTAASVSGAFDAVNGLDFDNVVETGRELRLAQTSTDITLTAFQAAWGDTNLDRQIDSTDLFNILGAGTFNNPAKWPTTWARGDFDDDGDVDSDDIFLILATGKFNGGPYSSASAVVQAVPEPSAIVLAFAAFLGLVSIAARKGSAFAGRCS